MSLYKRNYLNNTYLCLFIIAFTCTYKQVQADLTSLAKNDIYPVFSTLSLDDAWLLTREQLEYKNLPDANKKKSRVSFSITPFGQNANQGKTIKGTECPGSTPTITLTPPCPGIENALGDLTGRSNMLALLYGSIPEGYNGTYPGGAMGYLSMAACQLFPGTMPGQVCSAPTGVVINPGTINTDIYIDPQQLFGCFSFPLNYRKRGVRFELAIQLYNDLLLRVQAGVSSIRQVVEAEINLTNYANGTDDNYNGMDKAIVDEYLMNQLSNIAQQINLDIESLDQASAEEVRVNLCWRHAFKINEEENNDWSKLLIIPYFEASGSISPGTPRKPNQLFAVPFGNNGHYSTGCTAGINFDFPETIEIGGEIGFTHFFKKSFCNFPVPNSAAQTTIFPFQTNVSVQPGNNWHFSARIASYHCIENLSMHFEWFVVDHKQDKICLEKPDPAFLPSVLEKTTTFKTKLGNLGFNYDVSPNIGIGFLWQIPFSQRNTYRSSTIMAGVNITF